MSELDDQLIAAEEARRKKLHPEPGVGLPLAKTNLGAPGDEEEPDDRTWFEKLRGKKRKPSKAADQAKTLRDNP